MKILIITILLGFGVAITPVDSTLAQEWNFVKEEHGIKLYNRTIEGFTSKEVKAVLDLDVDLSKASDFLMNPRNIEKWMSGCTMSIPKKSEGNSVHYYTIFDAPWPVSDRDDYGKMELIESSEQRIRINFQSIPKGTPTVSSMVRVPYSKGHLIINISKSGKKTLTYQFLVDRGGSLPTYLKDYLETTSPVKTVKQLKHSLESL